MNVFFDHCSVYTGACTIIYTLIAILYFGLEVVTCSLLLTVVDKCRDHHAGTVWDAAYVKMRILFSNHLCFDIFF